MVDLPPCRLLVVDGDAANRREVACAVGDAFEVDGFELGPQAIVATAAALGEGRPYAMAFIALQLQPEFDGLTTLAELRHLQPELPVVLLAEHQADLLVESSHRLRGFRQVIVLHKPLQPHVLRQLAESWAAAPSLPDRPATDALTGLVLRPTLDVAVDDAVEAARRRSQPASVLTVDIDHLHVVNEIVGPRGGDRVLAVVAEVVRECVGDDALLSRYAGDEFRALLRGVRIDEARRIAEALRERIEMASFPARRRDVTLTASIGLVAIDEDTGSSTRVLRALETACRLAQRQGGNRVIELGCADRSVARTVAQARWSARLKEALTGTGFVLYAQPIRPIAGAVGVDEGHDEVLLRMMNARGRLVSPRRFLPAAQRYNLAPDIDLWVLHSVLVWLGQNPGPRRLAVNLSGRTLGDPGALEVIASLVEAHRPVANRLGFEVTESATIGHLRTAREFMVRLTSSGATFALDDFGVGLSSFAYLDQLPVSQLKIDARFVRGARASAAKRAILNAFSDIGRTLNLGTVGEGVEDAETLALLAGAGVQYAQGYIVGRPEPLVAQAPERLAAAAAARVVPLRAAPAIERRRS